MNYEIGQDKGGSYRDEVVLGKRTSIEVGAIGNSEYPESVGGKSTYGRDGRACKNAPIKVNGGVAVAGEEGGRGLLILEAISTYGT